MPDTLVLRRGDLIPLKRPGLNVGSGHLKVYANHWLSVHLICQADPDSRFQTEADLIARDARFGSEAEVQQTRAGCPLIAISGHSLPTASPYVGRARGSRMGKGLAWCRLRRLGALGGGA